MDTGKYAATNEELLAQMTPELRQVAQDPNTPKHLQLNVDFSDTAVRHHNAGMNRRARHMAARQKRRGR